jgi:hypothetical protein
MIGPQLLLKEIRRRELWPAFLKRQKFDPDQPRDDQGQWTDAGGGGGGTGGWQSSSGATASELDTLSPRAKEHIDAFETRVRFDNSESAAFIDAKTGAVLHEQRGEANTVVFSNDTIWKVSQKNAVLTHNHPSGYAFSIDDVAFASRINAAELRVVAGEVLYRLKPDNSRWPDQDSLQTARTTARAHAQATVAPLFTSNRISSDEANLQHSRVFMRKLASLTGLAYYEGPRHAS